AAARPGPPACRVPCLITGTPGAPGSAAGRGSAGSGLGPPLRGMAGAHVRGRGRPLAFEPPAALAAGTHPWLARFRPPAAPARRPLAPLSPPRAGGGPGPGGAPSSGRAALPATGQVIA